MPIDKGFIKLNRSETLLDLLKTRPTAFNLLTLIALRARRTSDRRLNDLRENEAYVGDHENYGVTEQIYRTDKKFLKSNGLINTRTTNKGTIAEIVDTTIFDINTTKANSKLTDDLTVSQRPANGRLTTNKNIKNERKKEIEIYVQKFNELFGGTSSVTDGRSEKLKLRLKRYTLEQILQALENLSTSRWHRGENDRGWKADPDFLIRADEQVDKWLNYKVAKPAQPKDPLVLAGLERMKK